MSIAYRRTYPCKVGEPKYKRDGRAPIPTDPRRSAIMSRIGARNTAPELALRKALRSLGHTGYRLHFTKVEGRPDIAFVGRKVAVFVHGCFWHCCPHCDRRAPKSNTAFWEAKLDRNKKRDARKTRALRRAGWSVITVWECRLKQNATAQAARVVRILME